jgi:hypothetical protein
MIPEPSPPQAWGLLTAAIALNALALGLMVAWS